MEKLKAKIVALLLIAILCLLIIPTNVFATVNEDIQIVKTETGYIIYMKDMTKTEFKYATSTDENALSPDSINLNYINSVEDEDKDSDGKGNSVAVINNETAEAAKYLYIKAEGMQTKVIKLSFADDDVILQSEINEIEKITENIETEFVTNLKEISEEVDGVKYSKTIGGLKITDDEDSAYKYVSKKLPDTDYSELQNLIKQLNSEEYEEKNMYEKIKYIKDFINFYNELIQNINDWEDVENMQILPPDDAEKDDEYVVIIRKESNEGTKYDAKFVTAYKEENEDKIPARTETKKVKETTKLPITGESLVLFGILAVIVIALIIVFVRMKKLQNKGRH